MQVNEHIFNGLNYHLRTFGCQMNMHDSERIAGTLEALGALAVATAEQADIIIFMTCCVREAADIRVLGQVASLKNLPTTTGGRRLIAVGGCLSQRDGAKLIEQLPHIDVVFGTYNVSALPGLIMAALEGEKHLVDLHADADAAIAAAVLPTTAMPARREQHWHAWLPIMTGCNNYCSYCVVPYVRGREVSRPFDDVLRDVESLLADGVIEITLLGQNVNSYGRDIYGQPRFAEMLRAVGESGVSRLRFVTSHPKDLSPETIVAFAETPAVMPYLHLPFQSGSDRILQAMNRDYTAEHYRSLIHAVREACDSTGMKDGDNSKAVALSTDIIVGFPGETETDFEATLELTREIGFSQAFTFIYSRREGTPAAELRDDTPPEVIQERFQRLVEVVQQSAWQQNQTELGSLTPVLFEGASKRDSSMLTGRSERNTTVHVPLPKGGRLDDFVGRIHQVRVDEARTWYLRGELVSE